MDLPIEVRNFDAHSDFYEITTLPVDEKKSTRPTLSREILLDLLEVCDWNKAEAARRTGWSRAAIWKYMKKWNIPNTPNTDY